VLGQRPDLGWPADLYLEGHDQFRGWFQSSLVVGLGTRDKAPYRAVLSHGFVVDLEGRKMSKSLGNVVSPQQVMTESGSEVLRLWVSMVDFRDEMRLGREVLARTVEAYRKIRNTFRYLLSNLSDFDPVRDTVPAAALVGADRFALTLYARLARTVLDAYEAYDFQAIFHAVNEFVTVDLSAFFLDVAKDRLYTFRADSPERRSAQTAVYTIADGLTRLVAPILSVTADEIWRRLPGQREESVHLSEFPAGTDRWFDAEFEDRWRRLRDVRGQVNGSLEVARSEKRIGSSLEASVRVRSPKGDPGCIYDILKQLEADLPMFFIVSSVEVVADPTGFGIDVTRAAGTKCPRCWRFVTDLVVEGDLSGLCRRCEQAVGGAVASPA
jgi:isoleucyl-tRNA synthetase